MYMYKKAKTDKMKKLVFIDNDNEERANIDIDILKRNLRYAGKVPEDIIGSIDIVHSFAHENANEMYKLIFSGQVAVCTWSMYTVSHYNSASQFLRFLHTAATSEVKDIIYIDGSGMVSEFLNRRLKDDYKFAMHAMQAIEINYIITFDNKTQQMFRLRIDLKGQYKDIFRHEEVNLVALLNAEPVDNKRNAERVGK